MNTSITKSQGFTLVEMLIVVAIIGILSTIAYPSYIHYIERGYQSQAHTELLAINNALKTELVKNPTLKIKDEIEGDTGLVKTYKAAPEIAAKYDFSGEMKNKDAKNSRAYYLFATPKTGTDYKLSVWMDSLGNAYKCTDAESAKAKSTSKNGNTGCEQVGYKK
ncbi:MULTISPECIES: PilX family type IV pilin [Neisseriaceae]|jgi:prepilin-type N-cleavage/methylation domain protein|uniref:PilX family type IV pilin n=1 Tax=Neisseriaceae TaxID=481 RepID=UPI0006687D78|nr:MULTISPECIES: PilX family type IV pilin [Neisseriaceae]MDU4438787.1 PilX family type IV pilin [Neisseria sp.]OFN00261.1 type IV pilin [Neisseria sp. HMSC055F11]OFN33219.1 type IV pilin [Neisseria sp. HMSC059F02]OHR43189.1 type IV pilin [Neisseria sp. HMSC070E12]